MVVDDERERYRRIIIYDNVAGRDEDKYLLHVKRRDVYMGGGGGEGGSLIKDVCYVEV